VEAGLYQYVTNTWEIVFAVLMEMLHFKGCLLAGKHSVSISEFKVSSGWVRHFMASHNLAI
jgi:hypothetical protein